MLEFIKDNWANILLIIVGSFALATYILQERKKKIDAASLIVLQIDEFQERLREISTFIVDGQLNETAFYESLPLMDTDYWNKYKHYFVRKMDATSYTALNQLYEYVSEIQEQQMLMKAFQKNSLDDLTETIEKNKFFQLHDETKHIKLAMFAFKTRIGKQRLYKEFGYKYDRSTKGYIQERLPEEKTLDYFVCLHRESLTSSARDKQVFFLKDGQDRQFYVLDNHFPIMQNFSRLIQSLQN